MQTKGKVGSMNVNKVKKMVMLGVLVAMEVVLSRFLSISTPLVKIGFSFIPLVVLAMAYGPLYSAIGGAMGDFIGAILFPIGPYFPGFTASAFLTGLVFGLFLYKHQLPAWEKPECNGIRKLGAYAKMAVYRYWRVVTASILIAVVVTLALDTIWLHVLYGDGFIALLPSRLLKAGVMIPLQTIVTILFCYRVASWIKK